MVEITIELIRSKLYHLSHNESYTQLHELSLHQSNITEINKLIQSLFPNLHILYLQNNYISQIHNIYQLKQLQYLNLSINNINLIPKDICRLEMLQKLDLTLNFIPLHNLHSSLIHLQPCLHLTDLTLLGNPCATQFNQWYNTVNTSYTDNVSTSNRYRLYAISILRCHGRKDKCNVLRLDGSDITPTELILTQQLNTELQHELQLCIEYCKQNSTINTTYTAEQRLADYESEQQYNIQKQQHSDSNNHFITPTNPIDNIRRQMKQKVIYDDSNPILPVQRNTGKYQHTMNYNSVTSTGYIELLVSIPVYIQLNDIDVDIQQQYIQFIIDGHNLLIHIQYDYTVVIERCTIQRITMNGELIVKLAVQQYIHLVDQSKQHKIDVDYSNINNTAADVKPVKPHRNRYIIDSNNENGSELSNTVVPKIMKRLNNCRITESTHKSQTQLGKYFDDSDVPPLE